MYVSWLALCGLQVDSVCYNSLVPRTSLPVPSGAPRLGNLTGLDPLVTCCVTIYPIANCSLSYGDLFPLLGAQATFCQQTSDVVPLGVRSIGATLLSPTSVLVFWDTPLNYLYAGYLSTVSYVVTVLTQNASGVTMTTMAPRLILTSLNMYTSYNVSVTAASPAGSGPPSTVTFSTNGSAPPPPPINLTLQFVWVSPNNLTALIGWVDPTSVQYRVTSYTVRCRCNDIIYNETTVMNLTATFAIQQLAPYVWCSATVQGVNSVGRSLLSSLVENYYPQYPPPVPGCYEATNLGSELDFEFDVTDPLTLTNKTVSTALAVGGRGGYVGVLVGGNGVRFTMLARNLTYLFQVALCNRVGCSPPCVFNGTTLLVSFLPCVSLCLL